MVGGEHEHANAVGERHHLAFVYAAGLLCHLAFRGQTIDEGTFVHLFLESFDVLLLYGLQGMEHLFAGGHTDAFLVGQEKGNGQSLAGTQRASRLIDGLQGYGGDEFLECLVFPFNAGGRHAVNEMAYIGIYQFLVLHLVALGIAVFQP